MSLREPLSAQNVWRIKIALYLFLAGMGAGAYTLGVAFDLLLGEEAVGISKAGVLLGSPLVFIGMLFLILDLGNKKNAFRAYVKPQTSWIARGTYIISIFMILGAIHIGGFIWPFNFLEQSSTLRLTLGLINSIFAFGTMIYTGLLLGAVKPIPLWTTPLLPTLFLFSALSTGAMATVISTAFFPVTEEILYLIARYDLLLMLFEAALIAFYIYVSHQTQASRYAALVILKGWLSPLFWIGIVLLGILIPLFAESAFLLGQVSHELVSALLISGIVGGYALRHVVVSAGIKIPIQALGIAFVPYVPRR